MQARNRPETFWQT